MEAQLFDGDRFLFRVPRSESLWELVSRDGDGPLDAAALRGRVEAELRRLRPHAVEGERYDAKDVEVLGERLRLPARIPANQDLLRALGLHAALDGAGGELRVFVVPDIARGARRLARLLEQTGPLATAELQPRLAAWLGEIDSTDAHVREALARDAEAARDLRKVFAALSELSELGLAEERDGMVRPTEKLRLILL